MASQPTPATAYGTSTVLLGAQAQAGGAKCRGTKVRFEAYQVNPSSPGLRLDAQAFLGFFKSRFHVSAQACRRLKPSLHSKCTYPNACALCVIHLSSHFGLFYCLGPPTKWWLNWLDLQTLQTAPRLLTLQFHALVDTSYRYGEAVTVRGRHII
jgi:hypothetical protein